ncbi:MAG: leucyl/phenylalanyl-tRNA--protein transferase [Bacteroidota bacterium]
MPVYALTDFLAFPPISHADENGLLAVGGDLSVDRLLLAYQEGIFPWYSNGDPILWWSPNPRFVLYPDQLKVSKSMRQVLRKGKFQVTYDQAFREVISQCRRISRPEQQGTWITGEMQEAYCDLHEAGFAHSVEVWEEEALVGGLYGISLGKCFFGESMFAKVSNASKAAFIHLVRNLQAREFVMVDCQIHTQHLESLGAVKISRETFQEELQAGVQAPTLRGSWKAMGTEDNHLS